MGGKNLWFCIDLFWREGRWKYKERAGTMPSFLTTFKSYCLFIHYFDDALTFILQICVIHNCTFSTNYKAVIQELLVDTRVRVHIDIYLQEGIKQLERYNTVESL